jgi:hypothetical protein
MAAARLSERHEQKTNHSGNAIYCPLPRLLNAYHMHQAEVNGGNIQPLIEKIKAL